MSSANKKGAAALSALALMVCVGMAKPVIAEGDSNTSSVPVSEKSSATESSSTQSAAKTDEATAGEEKTEDADAADVSAISCGQAQLTRTDKAFLEGEKAGKYQDIMSQLDSRSFEVTVPVSGISKAELEQLIKDGKITWDISRTRQMAEDDLKFDSEGRPGQYPGANYPNIFLGGPMEDWKTMSSRNKADHGRVPAVNPSKPFFKDVKTEAVEKDGKLYIKLSFTNELLWGFDGNDVRFRGPLRSSTYDYLGHFNVNCMVDGQKKATTQINFRPYDEFQLLWEINDNLYKQAEIAKENGMYAEVITYGHSANGRPMNALIVSKSKADLDNYKALKAREEKDPAGVLADVKAGKDVGYKAPIFYTNVHSDEVIASDGVSQFMDMLCAGKPVTYKQWTNMTQAGKEELKSEMDKDGRTWSKLIADKVTGMGYIRGTNPDGTVGHGNNYGNLRDNVASSDLSQEEIDKYYNTVEKTFDPHKVLDHAFFVLIPTENPDARAVNARTNGNGFDLNRDNNNQTQPETQAMTKLISQWNPLTLHELHGYYEHYQLEPCSPTHDPNNEYDLFIDNAIKMNEAFASVSLANNDTINSCQIPMRDFLNVSQDTKTGVSWDAPFDDVSTSYTPQYAMTQGVNGFTIEAPYGNSDGVKALTYGLIGNAEFVNENWKELYTKQLERYVRGVENIDSDAIRPYYVAKDDTPGAMADIYRPRDHKDVLGVSNNNFFPEYFVIPMDGDHQRDMRAAKDLIEQLIRNGVTVQKLDEDVTYKAGGKSVTYKAGTYIVPMRQAKRNVANGILYSNFAVISKDDGDWADGDYYSEPISDASRLHGFDMDEVRTKDVFGTATNTNESPDAKTIEKGEGKATIIENNGLDAVKAVNDLLANGVRVGYVVEGPHRGSFIVNTKDIDKVDGRNLLRLTKTNDTVPAKELSNTIAVYVPKQGTGFQKDSDGNNVGMEDYDLRGNTNNNWDFFALKVQMGFKLTDHLDEASVIAGSMEPDNGDEVAAAIKNGTPYVGYTSDAMAFIMNHELAPGLQCSTMNYSQGYGFYTNWTTYNALANVVYPTKSLITAPYEQESIKTGKVQHMYGYGANTFVGVPEGAQVLIKTTSDSILSGIMNESTAASYKNSIQAIDYKNMALFANSLTNKAHQTFDYRYLSNAIFSKTMTNRDFVVDQNDDDQAPVNPENPDVNPDNPDVNPGNPDQKPGQKPDQKPDQKPGQGGGSSVDTSKGSGKTSSGTASAPSTGDMVKTGGIVAGVVAAMGAFVAALRFRKNN